MGNVVIFAKRLNVMMIVSAREFRNNQTKVLSAAKKGQSIILTSRVGNFKIAPVSDSDNIVESGLRAACEEVRAHMRGDMELPLAQDVIF